MTIHLPHLHTPSPIRRYLPLQVGHHFIVCMCAVLANWRIYIWARARNDRKSMKLEYIEWIRFGAPNEMQLRTYDDQ